MNTAALPKLILAEQRQTDVQSGKPPGIAWSGQRIAVVDVLRESPLSMASTLCNGGAARLKPFRASIWVLPFSSRCGVIPRGRVNVGPGA